MKVQPSCQSVYLCVRSFVSTTTSLSVRLSVRLPAFAPLVCLTDLSVRSFVRLPANLTICQTAS
jgi:hypothetical protein